MWIFLPFGFFSVVRDLRDTKRDVLLVRARSRADIEELARRMKKGRLSDEILHTPANDYPYRIRVTRRRWALFVADFVEQDLDYGNFKSECAKTIGGRAVGAGGVSSLARLRLLHDVWEVMRGAEDARAHHRSTPAPALDG